jgi:hypothetical protein
MLLTAAIIAPCLLPQMFLTDYLKYPFAALFVTAIIPYFTIGFVLFGFMYRVFDVTQINKVANPLLKATPFENEGIRILRL